MNAGEPEPVAGLVGQLAVRWFRQRPSHAHRVLGAGGAVDQGANRLVRSHPMSGTDQRRRDRGDAVVMRNGECLWDRGAHHSSAVGGRVHRAIDVVWIGR